jgi:short-subunit dehydrogenase
MSPVLRLKNRIAVVTGGASGIGRAICEQLASGGACVMVADVDVDRAKEVAASIRQSGGQADAAYVDVACASHVDKLVSEVAAKYNAIDYMFNNAAVAVVGELRDGNVEDFRRVVDVNLLGVVHGTMAAYRIMLRQKFGHIVNIASVTGLMPTPVLTAYSTTKWAIVGFSTALRVEAAGLGVKVSVACPGLVRTNIADRTVYWNVSKEDYLKWIPWQRMMLTPAEAANGILRGVTCNKGIIIYPFSARVAWLLYRVCPPIFAPLLRKTLNEFRALRLKS